MIVASAAKFLAKEYDSTFLSANSTVMSNIDLSGQRSYISTVPISVDDYKLVSAYDRRDVAIQFSSFGMRQIRKKLLGN